MHADDPAENVELDEEETPVRGMRRGKTDDRGRHVKGRGFNDQADAEAQERYSGKGGEFMEIDGDSAGPIKSVEGWIIFVTGVHEEASEDDILDKFSDAGEVKNVQVPLDRRTGFVKGYALIEYATKAEAERAIQELDGTDFNGQTLHVAFAFSQPARRGGRSTKRSGRR